MCGDETGNQSSSEKSEYLNCINRTGGRGADRTLDYVFCNWFLCLKPYFLVLQNMDIFNVINQSSVPKTVALYNLDPSLQAANRLCFSCCVFKLRCNLCITLY